MNYKDVIRAYVDKLVKNPTYKPSKSEITAIKEATSRGGSTINYSHPLISYSNQEMFENKGLSDEIAIKYWNLIFPNDFKIYHVSEFKPASAEYTKYVDRIYPKGEGADILHLIRYAQAFSSSSFIGIQRPKRSKFALDSMIKTLESHNNAQYISREWLIPALSELADYVRRYPRVAYVGYEKLCLTSKTSSASMSGYKSFRDYVHMNPLEDVIKSALSGEVPCLIYAGTRSDRRGKYRLICSFDARVRIIDYLANHASYNLCEGDGLFSRYTTEGYSNSQLWPELIRMSSNDDIADMVCIDYSGYDTQIFVEDYVDLSKMLNYERLNSDQWQDVLQWYYEWMLQPKPLVTKSSEGTIVLIDIYRTLASGLHATHSFENLIGIATMKHAEKLGMTFLGFWSNGDDQNALIKKHHTDDFIRFLNDNFIISPEKSLIGHKLKVWSKLWFSRSHYPFWEMGTIRSILEREGGEVSFIEPSKFQSNYCKIVQSIIVMIRLELEESKIIEWMEYICEIAGIDHRLIPLTLTNLNVSSSNRPVTDEPRGLVSVEKQLRDLTFPLRSLSDDNYYDMLVNSYKNRTFYNLEVNEPMYHPKGAKFCINRGKDYSRMVPRDVPWVYRGLFSGEEYSQIDQFNRDVLQGCKAYDGPCSREFYYYDMLTLAKAINARSEYVWLHMLNQ